MRWKDCVKRDLERAGTKGQEWKTIAEDRGRCRELATKVEEATKWLGPHLVRKQGEEEEDVMLITDSDKEFTALVKHGVGIYTLQLACCVDH